MDWLTIGLLFGLFIVNTIVQFRMGFKAGAVGGYAVGVFHTVKYLVQSGALECDDKDTGKPARPVDIAKFIMHEVQYEKLDPAIAIELTSNNKT